MKMPFSISKRQLSRGLVCFLVGILWVLAIRFILIARDQVHYHANFAVYINGQREQFDNFIYYEEVQACGGDEVNNPRTRIHMHDHVNHVVHVHDNAATWGHFFANLGFGMGSNYIKTDKGVFTDGTDGKKLNIWLNGQPLSNAYNTTVKSEDVLLVSFGNEDQAGLQTQLATIARDAAEYNKRNDPSACTGGKPFTLKERFEKTVKFWQ